MTLITSQNKYPNYPAFYNLVKRRWNTEEKLSALLSKIDARQEINLAPHLNRRQWNVINLIRIQPLTALKAVLCGNITSIQMATLFQLKNGYAVSNGNLEVVPLFENEQVSAKAKAMIQSTLYTNAQKTHTHLDEIELEHFFREMRLKPLSEQRFFVIPNSAPPEDRKGNVETLSQVLHELDFDLFSNMPEKKWMIPSFGMKEAYSTVFGKNGPIKVEPVIGFSTQRQIIEGMCTRTRDFAFELQDKEITFDGVNGRSIEGPAHDLFHLHNHLILPPLFLEAFGKIALFLLDEAEISEEKNQAWLKQVVEEIADQENPELRKDDPGTLNFLPNRSTLFWFFLGRAIDEAAEGISPTFMSPSLRSLISYLANNCKIWIDTYKIDFHDIPLTKEVLDQANIRYVSIDIMSGLTRSRVS